MGIKFEGDPPYDLPVAQTAYSRPQGEIVEAVLIVSVPGIQPETVEVRAQIAANSGRFALNWEISGLCRTVAGRTRTSNQTIISR